MEKPTMKTFRPESMSATWKLENPVDRTTAWVTPSTPPVSHRSNQRVGRDWAAQQRVLQGRAGYDGQRPLKSLFLILPGAQKPVKRPGCS